MKEINFSKNSHLIDQHSLGKPIIHRFRILAEYRVGGKWIRLIDFFNGYTSDEAQKRAKEKILAEYRKMKVENQGLFLAGIENSMKLTVEKEYTPECPANNPNHEITKAIRLVHDESIEQLKKAEERAMVRKPYLATSYYTLCTTGKIVKQLYVIESFHTITKVDAKSIIEDYLRRNVFNGKIPKDHFEDFYIEMK